MIHRYPVHLTTLEEDFRNIGLLPAKEISEVDDSTMPRDIPSPDPSTLGDLDDSEGSGGARHKYAKQPRPKMTPDESDDHDSPEEAGATQSGSRRAGKYMPVAHGKEASLESVEYKTLKDRLMARAKDKGHDPAIAQGLDPAENMLGGKRSKMESVGVSRAAQLVNEVEELIAQSQASDSLVNLFNGFNLVAENCALLANRLNDISEHYNVSSAIDMMENLYHSAVEACDIIEGYSNNTVESVEDELDIDSLNEAFRVMTLSLMDAVEAYDNTLSEMYEMGDDEDDGEDDDEDEKDDEDDEEAMEASDEDDDEGDDEKDDEDDEESMEASGDHDSDDSDDDSDDDDSDDDDSDDDDSDDDDDGNEKGGDKNRDDDDSIHARMARLRAMRGKGGPFGK